MLRPEREPSALPSGGARRQRPHLQGHPPEQLPGGLRERRRSPGRDQEIDGSRAGIGAEGQGADAEAPHAGEHPPHRRAAEAEDGADEDRSPYRSGSSSSFAAPGWSRGGPRRPSALVR